MPKYKVVSPPVLEPVTLAEAKQHARLYVDDGTEDAYVSSLVTAAREKLEATVCRAFITQTIQATFDGFSHCSHGDYDGVSLWRSRFGVPFQHIRADAIQLLYPPIQSVDSITYVDANGDTQTIDPGDYQVNVGTPGSVSPASGKSWPTPANLPDSVRVTFKAGYGDSATDVPEVVKLVVKIMVAHWYDRREPIVTGTIIAQVPFMVDALSASLRWGEYP